MRKPWRSYCFAVFLCSAYAPGAFADDLPFTDSNADHSGEAPAAPVPAEQKKPEHEDTYDPATKTWIHYDPEYLGATTTWGFELEGTPNALGTNPISPYAYSEVSSAVAIEVDYQPLFLQAIGVVGFGVTAAIYPTLGSYQGNNVTNSFISIFGVGVQARYQAKFWNQQLVVPYVTYETQSLHYSFNNGPQGSAPLSGYSLGLSLLLNRLEPEAGRDLFGSSGISRTYAIVEVKSLAGSDANTSISGNSIYFGFRFER